MDNVVTEINSPATESFKKIGNNSDTFSYDTLKYVLIVLILAFLGLNIFNYLGRTTDILTNTFGPLFKDIAKFFGYTLSKTVHTSAKGAKVGIDITSDVLKDAVDLVDPDDSGVSIKKKERLTRDINDMQNNLRPPKPTDSTHIIQRNRNVNKSGYCYIGEDRGIRSCLKVKDGDKCMSGEVFPTRDICINPNLRM